MINATSPTTVSATYDRWAIAELHITGDGCVAFGQQPNPGDEAPTPQPVSIAAVLVKARVLPNTLWERSSLPEDRVRLELDDVYAFIATNTPQAQAVAAAMGAVVTALGAVGQEQGVL